ncbi:toll/interleukin-1 receptor domain-containing protein [Goodfellowiella coeruleoviolacea]|uniref:TIR domain-containing protein n=1 Tax=Goodfellowiella coeruleoviolacea TaxID=334858 RepID=A0AAE3GGT5_9PSEU|nr:toll/interleukin-1 receptor domain-containing protein [Goodfellowiella coeruleoviolacea]MCP2167112.1 TIR domain-containing protein [Goodfellowiella coeruleoviolacea]
MSGIFINYRRGDHETFVAALADRLAAHFGSDQVFVDHQMRVGTRYPDELRRHLRACDVLVVVVHRQWLSDLHERLCREGLDWVRHEIAIALELGKPIVQALLGNATPPIREELPDDIAELALRQAAEIRAAHLAGDLERLFQELARHVAPIQSTKPRKAPKQNRKRLLPAIALRACGALSLPLLFALTLGGKWRDFASVAMLSLVLMLIGVGMVGIQLLVRRRTFQWERQVGVLPFRQYVRKTWIILVLPFGILVNGLVEFVNEGGALALRITLVFVVVAFLVFFVQRASDERDEQEQEWPPAPSFEPYLFRRAAARLHELLTAHPDWRPPRSRQQQQDAEQIYRDLEKTRLGLIGRRNWNWRTWLWSCHSTVPANYLGWTGSILGLVGTAEALCPTETSFQFHVVVGAMALLAVGLAAAALVLDRAMHRQHDTLLVAELEEWQAKLRPLVFAE